jgi:chromosome segregation ATPase
VTENARLKQEAELAKAQLAALQKEHAALKARGGGAQRDVDRASADKAAAEQALADTRQRLEQLVSKYKETVGLLETVETDKARVGQDLARSNQALDVCAARNVALYELGTEVLGRWEHEGLWSRLGRSEPFTRLKRTELENLIDDYRARADDAKLRRAAATPGPAGEGARPKP